MKNFVSGASSIVSKYTNNVTLSQLIRHKEMPYKNLYESLGMYPNNGVGFKIWRKNWPSDSFYILREIQFKGIRSGKAWGELTWRGRKIDKRFKIRGTKKRGLWKFNVNGTSITLDNGVHYSASDMLGFPENSSKREE